jgi:hypothetical protein
MPTTDAEIESLALRMIGCTLPKVEWTHRGHWAFAFWITRHRSELTEPEQVRWLISRYNEATGTPNTESEGYHHTITLASMRAARSLVAAGGADVSLAPMLDKLMATRLGQRDWLLDHWSRDTLFSVKARREWVGPDLAEFPY